MASIPSSAFPGTAVAQQRFTDPRYREKIRFFQLVTLESAECARARDQTYPNEINPTWSLVVDS